MLVAVQSFGSIWTARCARTVTEGDEPCASRRVLQHDWRFGGRRVAEPVVHLRPRPSG